MFKKIKEKKVIVIASICVLAIGMFIYGGFQSEKVSADNEKTVATSVEEASVDTNTDKNIDTKSNVATDKKSDKKSDSKSEKKSDKKSEKKSDKKTETASKPSNAKPNTSKPSQTKPSNSKPAHQHSWKPVYETTVEYVKSVSICGTCGAEITHNEAAHGKEHNLRGENASHYEKPIYAEKTYIDYYKCSCGATK